MLQQCKCSGSHLGLLPRKQYNWFYSLVVVIYLLHQSKMSKLLYCKTAVNRSIKELSSCSVVSLLRRQREKHIHYISAKLMKKKSKWEPWTEAPYDYLLIWIVIWVCGSLPDLGLFIPQLICSFSPMEAECGISTCMSCWFKIAF